LLGFGTSFGTDKPLIALPAPLVGLLAIEALDVDLGRRGLVRHRVGDLAGGEALEARREPWGWRRSCR